MIDVIIAQTHTSEYLLHKYWARKPHNVLNKFIAEFVKRKGVVADPFCGSGVFLREASKLGHKAYGFDVNPVATLLSDTTCNPPSYIDFRNTVEPILEKFSILCDSLYHTSNNESVRYYVHETMVECSTCKTRQSKFEAKVKGSKSICLKCGEPLSFALAHLVSTKISQVVTESTILQDAEELKYAEELCNTKKAKKNCSYDVSFTPNKRILAFKGMKTRDLFTERNFYLLSKLADLLYKIKDKKIKETSLLLLTASVAQCSRLIAYRNNLKTGGPAWSVPGFWVPAQHLETNPYKHLLARYKKFLKGIQLLNQIKTKPVSIKNIDCINFDKYINEKADLIFLDPPYGDSIPYMEFSMIWNSFLNKTIDIEKDISVSDRNDKKIDSWKNYKISLIERIKASKSCLNKDGKFLITFNNHDYRAWEALIEALQASDMVCISTKYQIPAVVSSKAQFAKDGSYISDIYSIYKHDPKSKPSQSLDEVRLDLIKSGIARDGRISKSVLYRSAFTSILKNNISSSVLKDLDSLIKSLYSISKNECFLLEVPKNIMKVNSLETIVKIQLKKFLKADKVLWNDFYAQVASVTREIGIPEPSEILNLLDGQFNVINGKIIPFTGSSLSYKQIDLF